MTTDDEGGLGDCPTRPSTTTTTTRPAGSVGDSSISTTALVALLAGGVVFVLAATAYSVSIRKRAFLNEAAAVEAPTLGAYHFDGVSGEADDPFHYGESAL